MLSVLVVVSLVSVLVTGQDECKTPGGLQDQLVWAGGCCTLEDFIPETFLQVEKSCKSRYPPPSPPKVTGGKLPKNEDFVEYFSCLDECVFQDLKLLTSERTVDAPSVRSYFTASTVADLQPALVSSLDKCLGAYTNDVDPRLTCHSGAQQVRKCLYREMFLNCPRGRYSGSGECDQRRETVAKCPNAFVLLTPPPVYY